MEMLTESEAAAAVKVGPRTIRRMIEKGLLKASNYGTGRRKFYRIHPDDLRDVNPTLPRQQQERVRRRRNYVPTPQVHTPLWPPPRAA